MENTTIFGTAIVTTADHNGKLVTEYTYKKVNEKGELEQQTTHNTAVALATSRIEFFGNLYKMSRIAFCIESARLTNELAKKEGFKSVTEMLDGIAKANDIETNTMGQLYRTGKLFGKYDEVETETDGQKTVSPLYSWKDGINSNVTVTNLTRVLSLIKVTDKNGKDHELTTAMCGNMTAGELDKLYQSFKENYIDTDLLHLSASLSVLKKELEIIKKGVVSVPENQNNSENENSSENQNNSENENSSENQNNSENENSSENQNNSENDIIVNSLTIIMSKYPDNAKVKKAVTTLINELGLSELFK